MGAAPEDMARPQAEKRRDLKLASGDNQPNMLELQAARELFLASCTFVIIVWEAMMMTTVTLARCHAEMVTRCHDVTVARSR